MLKALQYLVGVGWGDALQEKMHRSEQDRVGSSLPHIDI